MNYLRYNICIENALQNTNIIKDNCPWHFLALYLALKKSATLAVSS